MLDDGGVEAVEGDAGVVDEEVDARWVVFLQVGGEGVDGGWVGYVEGVVFDRCEAAIGR